MSALRAGRLGEIGSAVSGRVPSVVFWWVFAAATAAAGADLRATVLRAVEHVDAGAFAQAIVLLEPVVDPDDDTLLQAAAHFTLASAYRGSRRPIEAIEAFIVAARLRATPPPERAQAEAALTALMPYAVDASEVVGAATEATVERLERVEASLDPGSAWRPRVAVVLAQVRAARGDVEGALDDYTRALAATETTEDAQQVRGRIERLRRRSAVLKVPCDPPGSLAREVFTAQGDVSYAVLTRGGGAGRVESCASGPIGLPAGQHRVLVWDDSAEMASGRRRPDYRVVELEGGSRFTLPYDLEPSPAESFSAVGLSVGGALLVAAIISHVMVSEPQQSFEAGLGIGTLYGMGGALVGSELIRLAVDASSTRNR